jgi:hypothetical protein
MFRKSQLLISVQRPAAVMEISSFPQFRQKNCGKYLKIGHDCLISHPEKFIHSHPAIQNYITYEVRKCH